MKSPLMPIILCCLTSIPAYACWQAAPSPLRIEAVSLNGRATVDEKPKEGIRVELRRAITFNRVEGWKAGLWEPKIFKSAMTGSDGLFTFGDVPPGRYWLLVARGAVEFPVEVVNSYRKPPYKRLWYDYFADGCVELRVEDGPAALAPSSTNNWPPITDF